MTFDSDNSLPSDPHTVDAEASRLMKQGIRLMSEAPTPAIVSEALTCFDRALDLRSRLPVDVEPVFGYGLAACWLNRGDALVRMGGEVQITEALRSYNEGILVLDRLPLGDDPRFPRRLAIAHQNRGLILQARGAPVAEVVDSLTAAVEVLAHPQSEGISDRQYLMAAVWMNIANAHATEGAETSWPPAREAALRAIALVADVEDEDPNAADVGMKARHVLCHTIARRLSLAPVDDDEMMHDVHEATDIADDGLHLARRWEQKGVTHFRVVAYDLFRFGARVYATFQPQFLDEFVADNMDPAQSSPEYVESPEMQIAAREALELRAGPEGSR